MEGSGSRRSEPGEKRVISASELAEFDYCALSWYFAKEGYTVSHSSATRMEEGTRSHQEVQENINYSSKVSISVVVALIVLTLILIVLFI